MSCFRKCIVADCGNTSLPGVRSLHDFPKTESLSLAWESFVRRTRSSWEWRRSSYSRICSDHFTSESFLNFSQWKMGGSKRLNLQPSAIPTVFSHGRRQLTNPRSGFNIADDCGKGIAKKRARKQHDEIHNIKEKYAFGSREFGMRKSAVVREVLKCPECNHVQKPNPSQKLFTEAADTVDPDYENEMNFIMLNDAPFCMALNCPSQNSVWFNQSGLAVEDCLFKKLLGVIKEVGIEVGKTTQNDLCSKERLVTKICCAERLLLELKKGAEKEFAFRIPPSHFCQDFDKLAKEYVSMADPALFLHDMNYLLNTYRRFRSSEFIHQINQTFNELNKDRNSTMKIVMNGNELLLEGSFKPTQQMQLVSTEQEDICITNKVDHQVVDKEASSMNV